MTKDKYSFYSSGRVKQFNDFSVIKCYEGQLFGEISFDNNLYQNDIDIGFVIKRDLFIHFFGGDEKLRRFEDWDFIIKCLKYKNGYKINRLGYVVNSTLGRDRVSDSQFLCKEQIANDHSEYLGERWYSVLMSQVLCQSKKSTLLRTIKLCFLGKILIPVKLYIKSQI